MTRLDSRSTTLISPSNDGESVTIIDIARSLSIDVRVSSQFWGATLDKEPPETFRDLKRDVAIVEIPGPAKEVELRKRHSLFIIDHHHYQDLDRSNPKSSLEQFAALIGYKLSRREMGFALNDRGYIPALLQNGYTKAEIDEIRKSDLKAQGYVKEDFPLLERDYSQGKVFKELFYVVETEQTHTSYLGDIHFWNNSAKEKNLDLIILKKSSEHMVKDVSFSGTPRYAKKLLEMLGGFCGGDERVSMYWGKKVDPETSPEAVLDQIYDVLCDRKAATHLKG